MYLDFSRVLHLPVIRNVLIREVITIYAASLIAQFVEISSVLLSVAVRMISLLKLASLYVTNVQSGLYYLSSFSPQESLYLFEDYPMIPILFKTINALYMNIPSSFQTTHPSLLYCSYLL